MLWKEKERYRLHETLFVPVIIYGVRQCYGKRRRDPDIDCKDGQLQRIARYQEDG